MLTAVWPTVVIVGAITGATWSVKSQIATQDDVMALDEKIVIAGSKADIALDRQMEAMIAQIARIEQKPNKTRDDIEQLRYLRRQLEILRKARAGR